MPPMPINYSPYRTDHVYKHMPSGFNAYLKSRAINADIERERGVRRSQSPEAQAYIDREIAQHPVYLDRSWLADAHGGGWEVSRDRRSSGRDREADYTLNVQALERALYDRYHANKAEAENAAKKARIQEASTDRFGYHSLNPNLNKIEQFLQGEKQRNNQLPLAEYAGPTAANKSRLTQRAEDLRTRHFGGLAGAAPEPYHNEIQELGGLLNNRRNEHHQVLDPVHNFLDENKHRGDEGLSEFFQNSFRKPIGHEHIDRFRNAAQERHAAVEADPRERLREFAEVLGSQQERSDTEKMEILTKLGAMKNEDRERLIGVLEKGGNIDTAIANMGLEANKKNFLNQAAQPHRDLARFEENAAPHFAYQKQKEAENQAAREHAMRRKAVIEAGEADIGPYTSRLSASAAPATDMNEVLRAYGVNNQNDLVRRGGQTTPLMEVAPKGAELNQLENHLMGADINDSVNFNDQLGNFLNSSRNSGRNIANSAIDRMRERIARQGELERKQLEAQSYAESGKFARKGLQGTGRHIRGIQDILAHGTGKMNEGRHKIMQEGLTNQAQHQGYRDKTEMMAVQLAALRDRLANQRMLAGMGGVQDRGKAEFNTAQNELDKRYIDKMSKIDYQWPSARAGIQRGAFDTSPLSRNNFNYI